MINNIKKLLFILILGLIVIPIKSSADELKSSENLYIPQGETITGNLYAASSDIIIDGDINGDLIAFAKNITINGRLEGDLIALSQTITVNGEINGNIRSIGDSMTVNGIVARNVNFVGNNLNIEKNAKINWDLLTGALNTNIQGIIKGNVYGGGDTIILNGKIGKNFNFSHNQKNQKINIGAEADISGDFLYNKNSLLSISDQANISGKKEMIKNDENNTNQKIWSFIYKIFAMLTIGLIISTLGKKHLNKINKNILTKTKKSLTWGFLASLIAPVSAAILIFTIIGLPLAIIIISLWIILLCLGKIVIAIFIGQYLLNRITKKEQTPTTALIIGVIIIHSLCLIPYLGWIISLMTSILGLGAILIYLKKINSYV